MGLKFIRRYTLCRPGEVERKVLVVAAMTGWSQVVSTDTMPHRLWTTEITMSINKRHEMKPEELPSAGHAQHHRTVTATKSKLRTVDDRPGEVNVADRIGPHTRRGRNG
jgi:hypothetical protein